MTNNTPHIVRTAQELGFSEEIGGGGALFLSDYSAPSAYVWLTCGGGGGGMPTDNSWSICTYAKDADGAEPLFSAHSDDEGAPTAVDALCRACEAALAWGTTFPGIKDWPAVWAMVDAAEAEVRDGDDYDAQNALSIYLDDALPHLFGEAAPFSVFALKANNDEIVRDAKSMLKALEPDKHFMPMIPLYKREFRDFDNDEAAQALIGAGWTDESWHNDICPHFTKGRVSIWTDFLDADLSEFPDRDADIYTVHQIDDEGSHTGFHAAFDTVAKALDFAAGVEGGNWPEVEAATGISIGARDVIAESISDLATGMRWIERLHKADLDFHFDDDPEDIVNLETGANTFSARECELIRERMEALQGLPWGKYGCPIGYLLRVQGHYDDDRAGMEEEYSDWLDKHNAIVRACHNAGRISADELEAELAGMAELGREAELRPLIVWLQDFRQRWEQMEQAEQAADKADIQPQGEITGNVLEHYARAFPSGYLNPSDAVVMASMPADSGCGADCLAAIKAGADLFWHLKNAIGEAAYSHHAHAGIRAAVVKSCTVCIAG